MYCSCVVRVDIDNSGRCRPCWLAYMRRYKDDPANKARAAAIQRDKRRDPAVKKRRCENERRYKTGCTPTDYDRLFEEQNGRCALCPATRADRLRGVLCADHDHRTGRLRGLLCSACNRALGMLGDTAEALAMTAFGSDRLFAYLRGTAQPMLDSGE